MAQYNSDGYIMVDFKDVDFKKTNQIVDGLFDRCRAVIGTNKFVLVINANKKTPLPSTVSITNGQYVIESCIYSFSISSNDNLLIKRNDVPASDIIDDNDISTSKTWSSSKIRDEIGIPVYATLEAGESTLTITNEAIDENSCFDWYTTDLNVFPLEASVTGHTLTMLFAPQSEDTYIKVVIT